MIKRLATLLAALALPAAVCAQQDYPVKPVTLIVPFAAGGPSDTIARLVGKSLSETLGQQFIVENVAGAGGTAGAGRLARSAADGYTLLVHHLAITSGASLYAKLPYETREAFTPLGLINAGPYVVTGRLGFEAGSIAELLARLRRDGAKITMAHSGVGAGSHLCATLLSQSLGIEVTQIAYRGAAQSTQDIIAGNVDLLCEQTASALPHLEAKKAKVFAVTSLKRVEQLPDVPTLDESDVKGFDLTNWHGLYGPKGLPAGIAAKLNAALRKALSDPDVLKRFTDLGTIVYPAAEQTPEAHAAMFKAELARWEIVVKKAGIKPQ